MLNFLFAIVSQPENLLETRKFGQIPRAKVEWNVKGFGIFGMLNAFGHDWLCLMWRLCEIY